MTANSVASVKIRPAGPGDRDRILDLLSASLGWTVDDRFRRYYEWKHEANPLGASPAWLAFQADELVGYRAFLRWEFEAAAGSTIKAARAVDVATHPTAQRRGVFRALTAHAVKSLRADGTQLVFTTPNEKAGRGWEEAGARELGRLPVAVRVRSPLAVPRMLRSRGAADRWPMQCAVGQPATTTMTDPRLGALLEQLPGADRLRTRRSIAFLQWRYGLEALGYRTLGIDDDFGSGIAVFRLRRRSAAIEAAVCDLLVARDEPDARRALLRRVAATSGADYVIKAGTGAPLERNGFVALPRQGPKIFAMTLEADLDLDLDSLSGWDFCLGDVELL